MDLELLASQTQGSMNSIAFVLMVVNALVHLLFAGAIAKDTGRLYRLGIQPVLVSGHVWAFATLLGGVTTALFYWLMHHSSLARVVSRDNFSKEQA